jgi:hypothetical protein
LSDGSEIVDLINRSYQQQGNMDEVRYWMVKEAAPKPLDHPRGSKFDYSNLGYTSRAVCVLGECCKGLRMVLTEVGSVAIPPPAQKTFDAEEESLEH